MTGQREWLRSLRNAKKVTARSVAEESGISESFYSLIESGERRPSPETAKKIADALGFHWTRFFDATQDAGTKPKPAEAFGFDWNLAGKEEEDE